MAYNYNIDKDKPPDTGQSPSLGAQWIRHFKEAVIERFQNWIYGFLSDSETDEGLKKAPFKSQATSPDTTVDKAVVYAKDVSGYARLFVKEGDGVESQLVPKGAIVMWSGLIANIPTGWHLCDGASGTPDLRDRFILGAAAAEDPGGTGGAHNVALTTANLPAHTHGSTGAHTHTVPLGSDLQASNRWCPGSYIGNNIASGSAGAHAHSSVGSGTTHENRPAFYKLAFIMKL